MRRPKTNVRDKNLPKPSGEPDEIFDLGFGVMARYGRFITAEGTLSREDHDAYVTAIIEEAPSIQIRQEVCRERLIEILLDADPIELIAKASLAYLSINPDTYREWESDQSPSHIEYIALQALGSGLDEREVDDPIRQARLTDEAIAIARELFELTSELIRIDALKSRREHPDDSSIDYQLRTRMESLGVRGSSYAEHEIRVLHGGFDRLDVQCRESLGFTATSAIDFGFAIESLISDRMRPRMVEAQEHRREMLKQLKHERRNRNAPERQFPDNILDLSPTESKNAVENFVNDWMYLRSREVMSVTPEELALRCSRETGDARAFLDAFTCTPDLFVEEHHRLPSGAHPLTTQPFIRAGDGYLIPAPSSLLEALRPRMEDLLHATEHWERYVITRARYLENEAATLLGSAIPGSRRWLNLSWNSQSVSGELDGLVSSDCLTLRLQCKAGRLTAPARRGAPERMKNDIGALIRDAAEQHQALFDAEKSEGASHLGFTHVQVLALESEFQFEVIVCLDSVTVWATAAHELKKIGMLPEHRQAPWVLSLTDLMAVVDLISDSEFVLYLFRRQRLERDGRIKAHDELDWLGHYLLEGLFFDKYFEMEDPPDQYRLLSYTEAIDAWYMFRAGVRTKDAPKPKQPIPEELRGLIRRLEEERPRNWIIAGLALLDGDGESRRVWAKTIGHIRVAIRDRGWSNGSLVFGERYGLTYFVDLRSSQPEVRAELTNYSKRKAIETNVPFWIGIGEGKDEGLFVSLYRHDVATELSDVFLDPSNLDPRANRSTAPS